jgi:hypothetical protein
MSLETDMQSPQNKDESMSNCAALIKDVYNRNNELETMLKDSDAAMKKMYSEMLIKDEEVAAKDKQLEEYKNKMQYDVAAAEEVKASEIQTLVESHNEVVKAKDLEIESLKSDLVTANDILDAYKAKEAEMIRQHKIMSRVTELVQAGVDNSVAESTVSKFEALDDESFATIKSLVLSHMPEWIKPSVSVDANSETSAEATEEKAESTVTEDVLETAEVEPGVDLSVGSEDDSEVQNTRASLIDFVYSRLGKPQLNKGE